ncbi:MAG TPA: glycosyltransferase family 39 protein [Candidatus Sumerlaeota bacterium]|nr:glycosyltransferase family 39 protein [Candidatus Sumerlaeota bacterium]
MALAAFMRLYRIESIPPGLWVDEIYTASNASELNADGSWKSPFGMTPLVGPGWVETPNLYLYYFRAVWLVFGLNYLGVKMASVLPGIMAVFLLYFLVKHLWGARAALGASFLMAVSSWQTGLSRWGWDEVMLTALQLPAWFFLWRGIKRQKIGYYILSGFFTGLCLYTYAASKILAVFILLYLLFEASIQRGFWKRHKRGLGFFTCFLILTSLPIGINLLLRPSAFTARLGNVSITHDMKEAKSVLPLVENVIRHAGMFHYYSDPNVRHHLPDVPLLDFISGFFMALGLGIAIWGIRKPKNRFLLLWLLFALMGGIFSLRAEAPQSYRTGASAPAAFALCGIGFAGLLKWLAKTFQSRRVMISSFMVAILGLSGGINFHRYFLQYPRVKTLWTQFWGAEQTFQSRYLEKRSRTGKAILLDDAYGSNYFFVFTAARRIIMNVEPDFYNPYRPTENLPAGDVEIYFPPFRFDVYKAIASPERIRAVNSPNGEAVFYCANLSHRELKTAAAIEPWQNQTRGDGRVLFNARLILPEDYFSTMKLESPTSATLTIDGRAMLCPDDGERVIPLKKGVHGIEIVQESAPRLPEFKLLWRPDYEHLEEIPASFLLP